MSPETRVLRQAVETLAFEGVLRPIRGGWIVGGLIIRAAHHVQASGRVRLLGDPRQEGGRPLTAEALGRGLRAAGLNPSALLEGMQRSAEFLRAAGPLRPNRLALTGLALEAALIEGHPYHPCFKSRIGFSDDDNAAFGPEAAAPIQPLWLAVDPELVHAEGGDIAKGFAPPGSIPVHPWQWRQLSGEPAIRHLLAEGRLRLLDRTGPEMQATASLRTLAPRNGGDHLKLSLGVGVTSSVRNLVPWSVAVAPAISDWLRRVVDNDPELAALTILPEHSAVIVARGLLGGQLAAIRRSAPPEDAVPVSALSLTEPDGRPLIADWLRRHGTEAWLSQFLHILRPVWLLMTRHGIGLEAHGQNLLIRHDNGWPTGLIARDFSESLEYVPDYLSDPDLLPDLAAIDPGFRDAPDGLYHRMGAATDLRDLVMDCLIVHVLSDLADLLHRSNYLPESRFWQLVRDTVLNAPGFAMDDPLIPAESLTARLLDTAESSHPVPNPLGKPDPMSDPMPAFRIDDRLIEPATLDLPDLLPGSDPATRRIALYLGDKADCLGQILRLRAAGASCYPIHPETPREQALDLARRAGCDSFAEASGLIELGQSAPKTPGGVLIQMSSGTTGAPKVIARSWAQIETEIAAYIRAFPEPAEMTPVIAAPITHSYGLIPGVLVGQARGHVPVVLDSTNPKTILRHLGNIEHPLLYAAPPLLHVLARLAGKGGLHAVMSSGTVLPQPWFDSIRGATQHLFQQYGCSEAGCVAIAAAPNYPEDMGAPLPHIRLSAGQSDPAPVMIETADAMIDTGDLGVIDARGHLIFAGRAAEVIDVAGINVYPAEIETAAMSCTGLRDAVAFAIPDPAATQRPALAYAGEVSEAELDAHLAARLSPRQRPARLIRLAALPRGANGKIARRDLAANLLEAAQ
ncbi:IucA/IucC family protein [Paracoccus saliphilus]|uniref:AMP-binding protein n=1 Tax=Paracoccus saliphilus TaxID=405559 RepID=A0AA46A3T2_9RHOB|nr:IucA/IucC family protein [Paracoccus saliphilus]WCR03250.1 AMP-binding protein [Paracoccus saliphilus]SIS50239.1 Siderophore synthetase component [Paracoccus saliphilus]